MFIVDNFKKYVNGYFTLLNGLQKSKKFYQCHIPPSFSSRWWMIGKHLEMWWQGLLWSWWLWSWWWWWWLWCLLWWWWWRWLPCHQQTDDVVMLLGVACHDVNLLLATYSGSRFYIDCLFVLAFFFHLCMTSTSDGQVPRNLLRSLGLSPYHVITV